MHLQGTLLDKAGDTVLQISLPGAASAAKAAGCSGGVKQTCSGGCCQGKVGQVIGINANGFGSGGYYMAGYVQHFTSVWAIQSLLIINSWTLTTLQVLVEKEQYVLRWTTLSQVLVHLNELSLLGHLESACLGV